MRDIALLNPSCFQKSLIKKNEVLSLLYLKNELEKKGYKVSVFDYEIIEENLNERLLLTISKWFEIVGISCYYPYSPLSLAKKLKNYNPNLKVIVGGPMATLNYKKLLFNESPIDIVIFNEGEESICEILERIKKNVSLAGIKGTAIFELNLIQHSFRPFISNLDKYSFPIREKGYYNQYLPTIVSSRGCNGKCTFCSNKYSGKWRGRTPTNVFEEIKHIVLVHNQQHFQFVEPNFLENVKRADQIATLIQELPCNVTFDFACRIDSIINNKDVLINLKKAGALKILLGVENFDNIVLDKWKKEITNEQIRIAIEILNKLKLRYTISLILFHPDTSLNEMRINLENIENLKLPNCIDNIFNALILIPGTRMNPSTEKECWEFQDENIKLIFKRCIRWEQFFIQIKNNLKLFLHKDNNIKGKICFILQFYHDYKLHKFNYLKKQLNFTDKTLKIRNFSEIKNLKFIINKNTKITDIQQTYNQGINFDTGLIYHLNNTSIVLLNELKNNSFESFILQIECGILSSNSNYFYEILECVIQLLESKFLIIK